jgi:hypothetical protein
LCLGIFTGKIVISSRRMRFIFSGFVLDWTYLGHVQDGGHHVGLEVVQVGEQCGPAGILSDPVDRGPHQLNPGHQIILRDPKNKCKMSTLEFTQGYNINKFRLRAFWSFFLLICSSWLAIGKILLELVFW